MLVAKRENRPSDEMTFNRLQLHALALSPEVCEGFRYYYAESHLLKIAESQIASIECAGVAVLCFNVQPCLDDEHRRLCQSITERTVGLCEEGIAKPEVAFVKGVHRTELSSSPDLQQVAVEVAHFGGSHTHSWKVTHGSRQLFKMMPEFSADMLRDMHNYINTECEGDNNHIVKLHIDPNIRLHVVKFHSGNSDIRLWTGAPRSRSTTHPGSAMDEEDQPHHTRDARSPGTEVAARADGGAVIDLSDEEREGARRRAGAGAGPGAGEAGRGSGGAEAEAGAGAGAGAEAEAGAGVAVGSASAHSVADSASAGVRKRRRVQDREQHEGGAEERKGGDEEGFDDDLAAMFEKMQQIFIDARQSSATDARTLHKVREEVRIGLQEMDAKLEDLEDKANRLEREVSQLHSLSAMEAAVRKEKVMEHVKGVMGDFLAEQLAARRQSRQ